jgi:Zn-dependent protease/CBS domain-containing protein
MAQSLRLGKIWGIPIGVNYSWFIILVLITASLAVDYMPQAVPGLSSANYWTLGLISGLLLFVSVLFHELGHAYFAMRNNIKVRAITLFIFGGVAEMEEEPRGPGAEFVIAIAGPIASVVAAGFFYLVFLALDGWAWAAVAAEYLVRINLILVAFNLIPGFPLDGGRVLRSIIWRFTDYKRATNVTANIGRFVAYGFIGLGVFFVFAGNAGNGLWLVFIGWFLNSAAKAHLTQVTIKSALDGTVVSQVMSPSFEVVDANMTVNNLVNDYVLQGGPRNYFICQTGYGFDDVDRDQPDGMITATDVDKLPRSQWRMTPVARVMTAWEKLITAHPNMPLVTALQQMEQNRVQQLPVLQDGALIGILNRENVINYLNVSTRLKG